MRSVTAKLAARWVRATLAKQAIKQDFFKKLLALGGSFGVVSAYRPRPKHLNQQKHGELIGELQRRGYRRVFPLRGIWEGVAEQSVVVPGIHPGDLFEIGWMFEQDSVIYKSPDDVVGMYNLKEFFVEVAADTSGNPAFKMAPGRQEWSKDRNWSFTLNFLWGQKIPWNGHSVMTQKTVQELLRSGQLTVPAV